MVRCAPAGWGWLGRRVGEHDPCVPARPAGGGSQELGSLSSRWSGRGQKLRARSFRLQTAFTLGLQTAGPPAEARLRGRGCRPVNLTKVQSSYKGQEGGGSGEAEHRAAFPATPAGLSSPGSALPRGAPGSRFVCRGRLARSVGEQAEASPLGAPAGIPLAF